MPEHAQREKAADEALARRDFATAERILSGIVAASPEDLNLWMKLAAVRRALGDFPGGLAALDQALRLSPLGWMPLLLKGSVLQQMGRADEASELYGAALFHCPPLEKCPAPVRTQIEAATRFRDAHVVRTSAAIDTALEGTIGDLKSRERQRLARYRDNVLRRVGVYHQEPTHYRYPELPDVEFFDRAHFPFLERLEAAFPVIHAEFNAVVAAEAAELVPYVSFSADKPARQWKDLNNSPRWTAIHLLRHGERVEANARHCPHTMALFESVEQPRIDGLSPNLMFSLLRPKTHIPPHHGVANTRVVLHLPLVVPPHCRFRVGAETREWRVGEAFAFDDTIEHEAWNDSDELRVVLIGDLWRPELSAGERAAVTAAMAVLNRGTSLGAL